MTLDTQKYLRMLIPGLMLYGVLVLFCWTTLWCKLAIPESYDEISKLLAAVLLGIVYHFTPFREIANRGFHRQINERISVRLTAPYSGVLAGISAIEWSRVRLVYYYFIDRDESLKVKSRIIRWNGVYWTSAADLRAVCVVAFLIFSAALACDYEDIYEEFDAERAGYPLLGLSVLLFVSFPASVALTRRHMDLCDEQCDYILLHNKEELGQKLKDLLA